MIRHQPLRVQVADHLRKEIISRYQPGDRLPTEADLAKRMGVSLLTLRDALATLAGDRLVVRQQGRGTFVGEGVLALQGKVTTGKRIAVLIELDIAHPLTSPYFVQVCQRTRVGLHDRGFDARLYAGFVPPDTPAPMDTTCLELDQDIAAGTIGAVIVVAGVPHMRIFDRLRAAGIPVIGDADSFDYQVQVDYPSRLDLAVDRFAELGRKRVAAVTFNPKDIPNLTRSLKRHRMTVRREWIFQGRHPVEPDAGYDPFVALWKQDPRRKPDALFVGDDFYLPDIVRAIQDLGISVPDELSVVTHANAGSPPAAPFPIDRVEVDPQAVADCHVATLERLMAGDATVPATQNLPFHLVVAKPARRS